MKISILTLFPEMFDGFLNTSIIKKARLKELVEIECIDIRAFTTNKHNRVDDYPFGGGQGLVMAVQPVLDALNSIKHENSYTLISSPKGTTFNQKKARDLSQKDHIIFICGHYEGIDDRILNYVDEEISIGDYILTGGELASMVVSDAIVRLIDGVIKEASHQDESFEEHRLEYPQFTRPLIYDSIEVPAVLLSGHHEDIRKYRLKESLRQTWKKRPDLFLKEPLDKEETLLMIEILKEELKKG
jgi:tRNA (guanine37-N1)-methyltransferase